MNCEIYCTPDGVALQTHYEDVEFKISTQRSGGGMFVHLTRDDLPFDLREKVKEEVWDFRGKEIGLIKGLKPVRIFFLNNSLLGFSSKNKRSNKEIEIEIQKKRTGLQYSTTTGHSKALDKTMRNSKESDLISHSHR